MLFLILTGCTARQTLLEMPKELKEVAALKESLRDVAALKAPMEQVAALDAPLKDVAELKVPLVAVADIAQPGTYVPMFGFLGLVIFMAIWGGVKLGCR